MLPFLPKTGSNAQTKCADQCLGDVPYLQMSGNVFLETLYRCLLVFLALERQFIVLHYPQ